MKLPPRKIVYLRTKHDESVAITANNALENIPPLSLPKISSNGRRSNVFADHDTDAHAFAAVGFHF